MEKPSSESKCAEPGEPSPTMDPAPVVTREAAGVGGGSAESTDVLDNSVTPRDPAPTEKFKASPADQAYASIAPADYDLSELGGITEAGISSRADLSPKSGKPQNDAVVETAEAAPLAVDAVVADDMFATPPSDVPAAAVEAGTTDAKPGDDAVEGGEGFDKVEAFDRGRSDVLPANEDAGVIEAFAPDTDGSPETFDVVDPTAHLSVATVATDITEAVACDIEDVQASEEPQAGDEADDSETHEDAAHRMSRLEMGSIDVHLLDGFQGWVRATKPDVFPVVSLRRGEVELAQATALADRADLRQQDIAGYGFTIRVADDFREGQEQLSLWVDEKFWMMLDDSDGFEGFRPPYIRAEGAQIHGYLTRLADHIEWPEISVRGNGTTLPSQVDYIGSSEGSQRQFRILVEGDPTKTRVVDVLAGVATIARNVAVIGTSKIRRRAGPVGRIDTVGPYFITGWMIGQHSEDRAFDVIVNGAVVGSGLANRPREDIEERFGIKDTAFVWPIPKTYKDGETYTFTIRRRSDGIELAASGQAVNLAVGNSTRVATSEHGVTVMIKVDHAFPESLAELRFDGEIVSRIPIQFFKDSAPFTATCILPWDLVLPGIGREVVVNLPQYSLQAKVPSDQLQEGLGRLVGNLDVLTNGHLQGWAAYTGADDLVLAIDVYIDGEFACEAKADRPRPDLATIGFTNHNHGFSVEVPEKFLTGSAREAVIRCALTGRQLGAPLRTHFPISKRKSRPGLPGNGSLATLTRSASQAVVAAYDKPIVTIVILTRNGAPVLKRCLESLAHFVPKGMADVVVVDHGSTDNTSTLIDGFASELNIRLMPLLGNGSFSHSNNVVALAAETEYVLFLNNDIILTSDAISAVIETLREQADVGAVGCKLIEAREGFDPQKAHVHHAGIGLAMGGDGYIRAKEIANELPLSEANRAIDVYGATGALLAMRQSDFAEVGGFPEHYFYGGEDVELSVLVQTRLKKRVVCRNDVVALHYRGYARLTHRGTGIMSRVQENERLLNQRIAYYNRKRYSRGVLGGRNNDALHRGIIGFVVVEADLHARAGEFFTALELAREYEALTGCDIAFITPDVDWYDMSGIDCLVVMLHEYDVTQIKNRSPNMVLAAWARNHFDFWIDHQHLEDFDVLMSSSDQFCAALMEKRGLIARPLKIGTAFRAMSAGNVVPDLQADLAFNGSHAGVDRSFASEVDPKQLGGSLAIFGRGWEEQANFADCWRGALDYERMPDVYRSARIVIDDANTSAREWGGTNSRVFDALAGGALVITNSLASSVADFDRRLPVWESIEDLYQKANHYLAHEDERIALVTELRAMVENRHTYVNRARQLREILLGSAEATRIAIKIGAPDMKSAVDWGDLYYAEEIAKELRKLGYYVRIDTLDCWYDRSIHIDVALVLRGLTPYRAFEDQLNILWIISHPESVSVDELSRFDHVFTASGPGAEMPRKGRDASRLLQFSAFTPQSTRKSLEDEAMALVNKIAKNDILFVGNTRNVRREFILGVHKRHGVKFIGRGWDKYVSPDDILAEHIDNDILPLAYSRAGCVLNDHWSDMKDADILSNRIFDVAASGGVVFSDYVAYGPELFGDFHFCKSVEVFSERWAELHSSPQLRDKTIKAALKSAQKHKASHRAAEIASVVKAAHSKVMDQGVRAW